MEDRWAELFVYFDKQTEAARQWIKQGLIELRNRLCGVYNSKIGISLFQVAEISLRSSNFSDFDPDTQNKGARTHLFGKEGYV